MLRVFKYGVSVNDHPTVTLPKGFKILSVGVQEEENSSFPWIIRLWVLVDPKAISQEVVRLCIAGTGDPVSDNVSEFLGTVMFHGLVFHVFREAPYA